jgi:hypothetical protein
MKPETQEWVEKAEGDLKVARREGQTADPVYDAVCFHAQLMCRKVPEVSSVRCAHDTLRAKHQE